jgi:hypothetical protein
MFEVTFLDVEIANQAKARLDRRFKTADLLAQLPKASYSLWSFRHLRMGRLNSKKYESNIYRSHASRARLLPVDLREECAL